MAYLIRVHHVISYPSMLNLDESYSKIDFAIEWAVTMAFPDYLPQLVLFRDHIILFDIRIYCYHSLLFHSHSSNPGFSAINPENGLVSDQTVIHSF